MRPQHILKNVYRRIKRKIALFKSEVIADSAALKMEDYENGGVGLSKKALIDLLELLSVSPKENLKILEFGSGFSTKFLVDFAETASKEIFITSFDSDEHFCYKPHRPTHRLSLHIRQLVSCSDGSFKKIMKQGRYERNLFSKHVSLPYEHPNFWRQRNCFYDIRDGDLEDHYDLVVLDGPNGNGRNIAFLHIIGKVRRGSLILIDDFDSKDGDYDYAFPQNLHRLFNVEEIARHSLKGTTEQQEWERGGQYAIYRFL